MELYTDYQFQKRKQTDIFKKQIYKPKIIKIILKKTWYAEIQQKTHRSTN